MEHTWKMNSKRCNQQVAASPNHGTLSKNVYSFALADPPTPSTGGVDGTVTDDLC